MSLPLSIDKLVYIICVSTLLALSKHVKVFNFRTKTQKGNTMQALVLVEEEQQINGRVV